MRKIVVISMITLDGVLQAPGGPEEDTSGGFRFGGWTAAYGDEVLSKAFEEEMRPSDLLLGRKTFQIWEAYWPEHEQGWPGINDVAKYVMSRTMTSSEWKNSFFLSDIGSLRALKGSEGSDLHAWGSGKLIQTLFENDLVDELRLMIFPLTLGEGKRLFEGGTIPAAFELRDCLATPSGVIRARYLRDGEVKTGTVGA